LSVTALHDTEGQINGYLGIARDLTEDLATQKTIELQRAKLISSSKMAALGEMAAGIAHEVNNPLAIIAGKTDLLLQRLESGITPSSEQLKDSLAKISVAAMRASKIITSLKSLSRNAEQDPMVNLKFEDVLQEALGLCSEKFKLNGIDIRLSLSSGAYIRVRSTQVAQIITNLLNNAFDAVLPLEEKWIEIKVIKMVNKIKVLFIDSGHGIPHELQSKLMQPFFTTKEVGRGTGLGLSISRGIAEEHGGDLYFDPTHANTCFVLELPTTNKNS
jgi:C4-dicarboxylate-specific signal transduction histidine kinase